MPVNPYGRDHSYLQVANDIARRIDVGEITLKLPSERALAEEYQVAYTTVRHAMQILRERELIVTIHEGDIAAMEARPAWAARSSPP